MNKLLLLFLCGISILAGVVYLAIDRDWIIIRLTLSNPEEHRVSHTATITKKMVKLYYWHHDTWASEQTEIIWSDNKEQTIKHLIDSWLTLLDEERLMEKKVVLQSVVLTSHNQEAYLSFDRTPFSKEASTYDKWMWVEGLLKTIRDNGIKLQSVRFLVYHQPLYDYHLDFSNSWPLIGFTSATK